MMDGACWKTSSTGINATDTTLLIALFSLFLKLKIITTVLNGCVNDMHFQKEFSKEYFSLNFVHEESLPKYESSTLLTFDPSDSSLVKILRLKPENLLLYSTDPLPPDFLKNVTIPHGTKFYFITISKGIGKCFTVNRPVLELPPKICLHAILQNNKKTWILNPNRICLKQIFYDMKGIQLKIAALSAPGTPTYRKEVAVGDVYWNVTRDYLNFKLKYVVRKVEGNTIVKIGYLFPLLLSGQVDAISVVAIATPERAKVMDFAMLGVDARYNFAIRKPTYEPQSWSAVIKPFTFEVWICFFFMIFLMSSVLWLTIYFKQKNKTDFGSCSLIITAFMCGQGTPNIPTTASSRITCLTALMFCWFTYQFYTLNFYASLSTKVVNLPFSSLEEFMAKKSHSLFIYSDTSLYTDMKNGNTALLKEIWDTFLKNNPDNIINKNNTEYAFKRVCDGQGAILALPIHYFFPTKLCALTKIEPGYFPSSITLALKKGFPYLKQFQIALLRALENGLIHKLQKNEITINDVISQDVVLEPVSLKQILLLIVILAAAVVVSVTILIFEIVVYSYSGNNRTGNGKEFYRYKMKLK